MAAGKVEVLLVVSGFDVDGGVEVRLVNKDLAYGVSGKDQFIALIDLAQIIVSI